MVCAGGHGFLSSRKTNHSALRAGTLATVTGQIFLVALCKFIPIFLLCLGLWRLCDVSVLLGES